MIKVAFARNDDARGSAAEGVFFQPPLDHQTSPRFLQSFDENQDAWEGLPNQFAATGKGTTTAGPPRLSLDDGRTVVRRCYGSKDLAALETRFGADGVDRMAGNFLKLCTNRHRTNVDLENATQLVCSKIAPYAGFAAPEEKLQAVADLMSLQNRTMKDVHDMDIQLHFIQKVYGHGARNFQTQMADLLLWCDTGRTTAELDRIFFDVVERIGHSSISTTKSTTATSAKAAIAVKLCGTGWDATNIVRVFRFLRDFVFANPEMGFSATPEKDRKNPQAVLPATEDVVEWMVKILRVLPLECAAVVEEKGEKAFAEDVILNWIDLSEELQSYSVVTKLKKLVQRLKAVKMSRRNAAAADKMTAVLSRADYNNRGGSKSAVGWKEGDGNGIVVADRGDVNNRGEGNTSEEDAGWFGFSALFAPPPATMTQKGKFYSGRGAAENDGLLAVE
eukprot:g13301.t1